MTDKLIRRLENNLMTIGSGVIAFGFWSFIKFVLSVLVLGNDYLNIQDREDTKIFTVTAWVFAILSALVYLWIGLSARKQSKGKKMTVLYLIMAAWIITFSTITIILEFLSIITLSDKLESLIITLIIDVTRMVILLELFCSAIKLRVLKKQKAKVGNAA